MVVDRALTAGDNGDDGVGGVVLSSLVLHRGDARVGVVSAGFDVV